MVLRLSTPGVYQERRPRAAVATVRTDVAGFVGFEPRLAPVLRREGGSSTVAVRVSAFSLALAGRQRAIRAEEVVLWSGSGSPMSPTQLRVDTLVAVKVAGAGQGRRIAIAGVPVAVSAGALDPLPLALADDAAIAAGLALQGFPAGTPWVLVAVVTLRTVAGQVTPCVHPRLPPCTCADLADVGAWLGDPSEDGLQLLPMVRAFFANGGARCHVVTVRRPLPSDSAQLAAAADEMIGSADDGLEQATGFARLALIDEVALADLPDVHATYPMTMTPVPLPGSEDQACFRPCHGFIAAGTGLLATGGDLSLPLFTAAQVWDLQRRLIEAAIVRRAAIEVILTPPRVYDAASGQTLPPLFTDALDWQTRCAALRPGADDRDLATAALYWPWLWVVEHRDDQPVARPPTGSVLGVIARRDLARGPFAAPANETLRDVVGLTAPVNDANWRALYATEPSENDAGVGINLLRVSPGTGIQAWGSRTLSRNRWFRHLPVRRGLSSIQRRLRRSLESLVFEPNTPFLWLQLTSLVVNQLMVAFRSGGLRGETPEEAFTVRCDASTNPPEEVALGRVWLEVGVAIAAPAEFIVFRLGRSDGAVLTDEARA